jgi:hypothetical protein
MADAASVFALRTSSKLGAPCTRAVTRIKALDAGDARAAVPLAAFKALYDVEATAPRRTPAR